MIQEFKKIIMKGLILFVETIYIYIDYDGDLRLGHTFKSSYHKLIKDYNFYFIFIYMMIFHYVLQD